MYKRIIINALNGRLREPRRFMQVLAGPRQSGKTTLARQAMKEFAGPSHYASADEPALKDRVWIEQQWMAARSKAREAGSSAPALIVLDEAQKIPGWSEVVKRLWDEDTVNEIPLRVMILGSSPLLVEQGLTESLAGRFEVLRVAHWSYGEMRDAFGWDSAQYVFYGGYPGAAALIGDPARWARYIIDSLIETSISRDVLLMTRVDKPALLRRLFELACSHSGQALSYQKMLGQLQDVGNTTTLAHYLALLQGAGLVAGLPKYSDSDSKQRASSPKLLVLNTALMSAPSRLTLEQARRDGEFWGRLVESTVGATLANGVWGKGIGLYYWLSRNREVDFVLRRGKSLVAIEVKTGRRRSRLSGMEAFDKEFDVARKLLVGPEGVRLEQFLLTPPEAWFE